MEIAILVVTIVLTLGLIALFVTEGVKFRKQTKKRAVCSAAEGCTEESEKGVKKTGFKEWWKSHRPSKRRLIQVYAALLFNANLKGYVSGNIYTGNSKFMCVPALNCYSCPGAVGACPLGALQNALRESNRRAPYYMLGILAIFCLMFARTICGFLCPVGLVQEWLYKIRTPKLKKSKATRVLSYFKYVLLAVFVIAIPLIYGFMDVTLPAFCKYICPAGTLGGAIALLINPSNASIFETLGPLFTWKFCVLVALCVASVFIYRVFCRFICPLGAIYSFFNRIALLGVKLDKTKCTDCGLCISHCKMDIRRVGDHECINCGECIPVCPTKAISWKGSSIFVKGTASEEEEQEKVKPLTRILNKPAAVAVASGAEISGTATVETQVETSRTETAVTEDATATTPKVKTRRGRNFWLQFAAWAVALCVLAGAFIYYNVIDRDVPIDNGAEVGCEVGELCPDFTLELYQDGGEYNLYAARGKITLINFWYIGCGGCEAEMPYIGELSNSDEYDVEIIAIHGLYTMGYQVNDYLKAHGWDQYDIKYAQDINIGNDYQTYKALGGKGFWPLTVILDEEGIVRYNSTKEFHSYEELKAVIDGIKG